MIAASTVKELRDKTNAGMMDCKKVLTETDGDIDAAIKLLRERGIAKASKKADPPLPQTPPPRTSIAVVLILIYV